MLVGATLPDACRCNTRCAGRCNATLRVSVQHFLTQLVQGFLTPSV